MGWVLPVFRENTYGTYGAQEMSARVVAGERGKLKNRGLNFVRHR